MNTTLTDDERKQKRAEYMRSYMKEYKKKKYHEDKEKSQRIAQVNYLKKTGKIEKGDLEKYGDFSCDVRKAIQLLTTINQQKPEFIIDILINSGVTPTSQVSH